MLVEVRAPGMEFTADLVAVPADGELITRYDGTTELSLRVVGGRRWFLDEGKPPVVRIRAEVIESVTE